MNIDNEQAAGGTNMNPLESVRLSPIFCRVVGNVNLHIGGRGSMAMIRSLVTWPMPKKVFAAVRLMQ